MYNEIKQKLRESFIWGMRRNFMDMQLFWDSIITVFSVVGYIGVWVALGLLIRWFIVKLKR